MEKTTVSLLLFTNASFNYTSITSNRPPDVNSLQRQIINIVVRIVIVLGMFGMGCGVDARRIWKHVKKPTGALIGVACQFVIMPLIAFGLAKLFNMNNIRTLMLMVMGSCPGGSTSNVAVIWLDGDVDLSITMTTASSLFAFGFMPLLLWIYSHGFNNQLFVPFDSIAITLSNVVFPCLIGMIFRWKFPKIAPILLKGLTTVGLLIIISLSVLTIITYFEYIELVLGQYISAAVLPPLGMLAGYAAASFIGLCNLFKLTPQQIRTIAVETGVQNVQLANGVIFLSQFTATEEAQVSLFPTIFFASQVFWIFIAIAIYKIYSVLHPHNDYSLNENEVAASNHGDVAKHENSSPTYVNFDVVSISPKILKETKLSKL